MVNKIPAPDGIVFYFGHETSDHVEICMETAVPIECGDNYARHRGDPDARRLCGLPEWDPTPHNLQKRELSIAFAQRYTLAQRDAGLRKTAELFGRLAAELKWEVGQILGCPCGGEECSVYIAGIADYSEGIGPNLTVCVPADQKLEWQRKIGGLIAAIRKRDQRTYTAAEERAWRTAPEPAAAKR